MQHAGQHEANSIGIRNAEATICARPTQSSTMTEDLNRRNELKRMVLCDSCTGIQRNWRKAPGHPELMQGSSRQEKRGGHFATVTRYRCDRCSTAWEYENDKSNLRAGWSVIGG